MCALLGCDGVIQPNIDENKLHTTPLAAPAAAPIPGEPPMAPPTAPAAAPPTAPTPALGSLSPLAGVRRRSSPVGSLATFGDVAVGARPTFVLVLLVFVENRFRGRTTD